MQDTVITKGPNGRMILRIIQGELKNWGYESNEIYEEDDAYGITQFKIEIKTDA